MLNQNVDEWISTLREEDRGNVRNFLNLSLDFLKNYQEYLQGSGLYIVGSSFTRYTYVPKCDYFEKRRNMEELLMKKLIERFGEETLKEHNQAYGSYRRIAESAEIEKIVSIGFREIDEEIFRRDHYDDVDCVIAGLPREKSDPKQEIWSKFYQHLVENIPDAKWPDLEYKINGFGSWDIYTDCIQFDVKSFELQMPTSADQTKMHFMLYKSDERFGSEDTGSSFGDHHPSEDVSLEMWKKQQEEDKLPFLVVYEF